jgi:hypothetical protein
MTAALVRFGPGHSGQEPKGPQPPSLYRYHDFCAECCGHHVIELSSEMATYLRAIAPLAEAFWADCEPELIHGCHPVPRSAIKRNTLLLTGIDVANLAESLETAYSALNFCIERLRHEHRPNSFIREIERDLVRARNAMSMFFQYHLEVIDPSYGSVTPPLPTGED